jgi:hypothetical protein
MARSTPGIRLLPPAGRPTLVLSGSGGRLRGDVLVANDGPDPVELEVTAVEADVPAGPEGARASVLPDGAPTLVAPGVTARARLAASLDPLTPPGSYQATVTIGTTRQAAVLEVGERVELSLSDTELIVSAAPGEQRRRMVATNRGNVPLQISRLGPVELLYDVPRPTLLGRMGFPSERRASRPPVHDADEPPPTIEGRLPKPVELAPGEVTALDWRIEVKGSVPTGIRYRATAALYTSDVTFVVTPVQEGPEPAPAAPARRTRERTAPTAAAAPPASRQKRRTS